MASETLRVSAIVFRICLPINRKNKRQFNFLPLVKYLYFIFRITPTIDIEPINITQIYIHLAAQMHLVNDNYNSNLDKLLDNKKQSS